MFLHSRNMTHGTDRRHLWPGFEISDYTPRATHRNNNNAIHHRAGVQATNNTPPP
jgi:hypothetical protein